MMRRKEENRTWINPLFGDVEELLEERVALLYICTGKDIRGLGSVSGRRASAAGLLRGLAFGDMRAQLRGTLRRAFGATLRDLNDGKAFARCEIFVYNCCV